MNNEEKQEAAARVKQARGQSRAAAKNVGRAAKVVAEPVVDAVVEEVQDTAEKLEGTAEDAVKEAKRVNPWAISRITSDMGQGFLALSVAVAASTYAAYKFRDAYAGRNSLITARRIVESQGTPSE